MADRIVIALGGNALGNTPSEQLEKIRAAAPHLVSLIAEGYEIIVTHGNGPQVGMISSAFSDGAKVNKKIPAMPLPECTAMSEGYIGYHLQQEILFELRKRNMPWHVSSMITQVEVDKSDPAFSNPTKPIGAFFTREEAEQIKHEYPDKTFKEDSGRGYREVVASPVPKSIVERDSILNLLDNEFIVIACGGGGIPVAKESDGLYRGVSAVIDKDRAAALLASETDAKYLFILTAVDRVSINFGKENEKELAQMTAKEALSYDEAGEFGEGSMRPKVLSAVEFVKGSPDRVAVITSLENAKNAMSGGGTKITQ